MFFVTRQFVVWLHISLIPDDKYSQTGIIVHAFMLTRTASDLLQRGYCFIRLNIPVLKIPSNGSDNLSEVVMHITDKISVLSAEVIDYFLKKIMNDQQHK